MHEVREFAGHSDIRTTELYFVRKEPENNSPFVQYMSRRLWM